MMVRLGNFLFHYRNGLFPLAYLLLFWKSPKILSDDLAALGIGTAIAGAGQLLRAITIGLAYIRRGGKNRRVYADDLVVEGIFAHCRNPLYVGNFLILLGLAFIANSLLFLAAGIPFFFIAYWAIIRAEENFLLGKFGESYRQYCARVHRVLPNFRGISQTLNGSSFHWQRLIVKEYGSFFAWTFAAILLVWKNQYFYHAFPQTQAFTSTMVALLLAVTLFFAVARILKKKKILLGD